MPQSRSCSHAKNVPPTILLYNTLYLNPMGPVSSFLLDNKIVSILFRTSNNFNSFNIELRPTEMLFSCFSIDMKSYGRIIQ